MARKTAFENEMIPMTRNEHQQTALYAPKKRGGYLDFCKWKTCITIHRIPEVLEV